MTSLQLIPGLHKQQPIVKVIFPYNKDLIALVKHQKGARWSQTLQSWYFLKEEFQLNPTRLKKLKKSQERSLNCSMRGLTSILKHPGTTIPDWLI